jgi:hypothetical protein
MARRRQRKDWEPDLDRVLAKLVTAVAGEIFANPLEAETTLLVDRWVADQ